MHKCAMYQSVILNFSNSKNVQNYTAEKIKIACCNATHTHAYKQDAIYKEVIENHTSTHLTIMHKQEHKPEMCGKSILISFINSVTLKHMYVLHKTYFFNHNGPRSVP